jgi:large subunit ribosomal protein L22
MATSKASLSNYRQSPRKVRLVADLVRGKNAAHALALLAALPKRASGPVADLIKSAVANAGEGNPANTMIISKVEVNKGVVLKRSMPRAKGRASAIRKHSSHISISLTSKPAPAAKAN